MVMQLNTIIKFFLYFASFKALASLLTMIITLIVGLFAFGIITPDKLAALADVGKDASTWQIVLGKIAGVLEKGAKLFGK